MADLTIHQLSDIVRFLYRSDTSLSSRIVVLEDQNSISSPPLGANIVYAGPSSGPDGVPLFRNLVNNDLPDSSVNSGTYNNITVNSKGIVTNGSNTSYLTSNQSITVSGDISGSGSTSITATLATVNTNTGSFGAAGKTLSLTVNGKGLVTSVSETSIAITASQVSGISASSPITYSGSTISTSMSTNKLLGRSTAGTGVVEQLSLGNGLSLSSGTLNVTAPDFVNVLDYGADNTGLTDTTAAINSAINNGTRRRIYIPAGTYLISAVYLTNGSSTNHQGIQLINGTELYGDGVGKTIIKLSNNTSATTVNSYFYPIINGHGVSNAIVHDLEIDGNRLNQGNYTTNPYTNPAGYYVDANNRWSTPGIMFKDSDNNEVYNVYIHDSQLNGVYFYNSTNGYTHHCNLSYNGSSGVVYHHNSSGRVHSVIATHNESDQIRFDDCPLGGIIIDCEAAWSGTSADAPNWMAGIYFGTSNLGIDTANMTVIGCNIHDNSAYGLDTGSIRHVTAIGNKIRYNGNGGIVTVGDITVIGNEFDSNGKRSDNLTDTHSNYNPSAISVNSVSNSIIKGNRSYNTNGAQIYFIKSWGGGGSTGFSKTVVANNYVKGVADVAHLYNGDDGTNTIIGNITITAGGSVIGSTIMSNTSVVADKYFTFNASVATGDTTTSFRVGSISSNDGICNVYDNSTNAKLLQFGGLALSLLGSYNLKGWNNTVTLGSALGGATQTYQITSATGDIWMTGGLAVGTSTADSKSILTLSSTTKGALLPRMTNTQRDAISSPTEGLLIYSTTDHAYEYYNGSTWKQITTN